jgi:hypothetical protein
MKEKIRPLYSELKGYLSAVPEKETVYDTTATSICDQLNGTIDQLISITGREYNRFKINPRNERWNSSYRTLLSVIDYKNKLSGLINNIQGEFFSEEQISSTGQPSTIINTHLTQSQSQSLSVALELQEKIISEIPKHEEGSKERNFLEKLKSALPTIKTVTDVLSNALIIGADLGLDPATIHKLLGL